MTTASERFEIITRALAAAEEQGGVHLEQVAREYAMSLDALKALLEPAIYCEFRDGTGSVVNRADEFLVTEDDVLVVTNNHWLRDLDCREPEPPDALRLYMAGILAQSVLSRPDPALERVVAKLRDVVGADLVLDASPPAFAKLCDTAREQCRVIEMRYFSEHDGQTRQRLVEPGFVGAKWRNWYMVARTHGTAEERTYRIDRILSADKLDTTFAPFAAEMPEWFDLDSHEHPLRLRVEAAHLKRIPPPARVSDEVDLGDGRVEATVTVIGAHRLADVLLLLGADAQIVDAPEMVAERTRHATAVLARYERGS